MRKSRFTEEQIVGMLKESEAGLGTDELCRKYGISPQTFYRWKAKYGGMNVSEAQRLKQLEDENRKLKQMVADLMLDKQAGGAVKKVAGPRARTEAVAVARAAVRVSERRACGLLLVVRGTCRYEPVSRNANEQLRLTLHELAMQRCRFGYRRLHALLRRDGWEVNHKRMYRLYVEDQLWVRKRNRKRRRAVSRASLLAPTAPDQVWLLDFVSDALASGRRFRTLNPVDDCTREALAIEVDTSLGGVRVCRVLDRLKIERGGVPLQIRSDDGPEFISRAVEQWAYTNGVEWHFIEPGRPIKNAYVESFNARFRDECLNENWFTTLGDARQKIEHWRQDYNQVRPHSALGYRTPNEFRIEVAALASSPPATPSPSFGYAVNPAGTLIMTGTKTGGQISPSTMFSAHQQYQNYIRLNCGYPLSKRVEESQPTIIRASSFDLTATGIFQICLSFI